MTLRVVRCKLSAMKGVGFGRSVNLPMRRCARQPCGAVGWTAV